MMHTRPSTPWRRTSVDPGPPHPGGSLGAVPLPPAFSLSNRFFPGRGWVIPPSGRRLVYEMPWGRLPVDVDNPPGRDWTEALLLGRGRSLVVPPRVSEEAPLASLRIDDVPAPLRLDGVAGHALDPHGKVDLPPVGQDPGLIEGAAGMECPARSNVDNRGLQSYVSISCNRTYREVTIVR